MAWLRVLLQSKTISSWNRSLNQRRWLYYIQGLPKGLHQISILNWVMTTYSGIKRVHMKLKWLYEIFISVWISIFITRLRRWSNNVFPLACVHFLVWTVSKISINHCLEFNETLRNWSSGWHLQIITIWSYSDSRWFPLQSYLSNTNTVSQVTLHILSWNLM